MHLRSVAGGSPRRDSIAFITLLRASAALLVVYAHLGADWPSAHGIDWPVLRFVRIALTGPLAIVQDFGFFGVVVFFLVSGFIITHVALAETHLEFAVKRLLRIYPPLLCSLLVIVAIDAFVGYPKHTIGDVLLSATLLNYFTVPQVVVNGVAWSLVIEMEFYALAFATLSLLRRSAPLATATVLGACLAVTLTARDFGPGYFLFAVSTSYVPFLLFGQTTYFAWSGKIGPKTFAALMAAIYAVLVYNLHEVNPTFLEPANSYGVSFLYAYLIFALLAALGKTVVAPKLVKSVADMSYSLYLLHGSIGFFVLQTLTPAVGFTASFAAALVVAFAAAYVSHRFVELPSQRYARALLGKLRGAGREAPVATDGAG